MEGTSSTTDLPRVLITSLKHEKAGEIASKMGAKFVSKQAEFDHYLLDIDNKYYTAQVELCLSEKIPENLSNFEAFIFYHDLEKDDHIHHLDEQIIPRLSESGAEIFLLVCDSISNVSIREKAIEWCALRKFELIELDQNSSHYNMNFDDNDDEDDDDHSKYGVDRIVECLETHMWSNLSMKDSRKANQPQAQVNEVGDQLENVKISGAQDYTERLQMESVLDGIMNSESADFGELFSNLRTMKEHADSMPSSQRKIAAEQLVTAFWKAIGGDPSEIED